MCLSLFKVRDQLLATMTDLTKGNLRDEEDEEVIENSFGFSSELTSSSSTATTPTKEHTVTRCLPQANIEVATSTATDTTVVVSVTPSSTIEALKALISELGGVFKIVTATGQMYETSIISLLFEDILCIPIL
jgi:pyrroline-5-carboxylate reductase